MTRTTPELAPPSPNFRTTPTGGRLATTYDLACNRPHTRRIFSGIGFRTCDPPVPRWQEENTTGATGPQLLMSSGGTWPLQTNNTKDSNGFEITISASWKQLDILCHCPNSQLMGKDFLDPFTAADFLYRKQGNKPIKELFGSNHRRFLKSQLFRIKFPRRGKRKKLQFLKAIYGSVVSKPGF
ncbi:hypothetical protein AVEN_254283-1 [Araneus ventricosus]|uniref:Uncharacterized protein n=1 Tax=Araneus ventricosus TaxID=182803 RepID=A0A4Y2M4C7_ARAVE|nr:hypothetical protein AVEN_254283-1 [Araneus ventricosus]